MINTVKAVFHNRCKTIKLIVFHIQYMLCTVYFITSLMYRMPPQSWSRYLLDCLCFSVPVFMTVTVWEALIVPSIKYHNSQCSMFVSIFNVGLKLSRAKVSCSWLNILLRKVVLLNYLHNQLHVAYIVILIFKAIELS